MSPHNRADSPVYCQQTGRDVGPDDESSADGSNESEGSSPSHGGTYSAERNYSHEDSSPVNAYNDENVRSISSISTQGVKNSNLGEFSPINVED